VWSKNLRLELFFNGLANFESFLPIDNSGPLLSGHFFPRKQLMTAVTDRVLIADI
jgi:hypothetical protein